MPALSPSRRPTRARPLLLLRRDVPCEVWYEPAGGGYRWRQSASEVQLQLLALPPAITRAAQLRVSIEPYELRVAHASSGAVYLRGSLARGVVPADSTWTLERGGAGGETGSVLLLALAKMNLELYDRSVGVAGMHVLGVGRRRTGAMHAAAVAGRTSRLRAGGRACLKTIRATSRTTTRQRTIATCLRPSLLRRPRPLRPTTCAGSWSASGRRSASGCRACCGGASVIVPCACSSCGCWLGREGLR